MCRSDISHISKAYIYLFDDMGGLNETFLTDNLHRLPVFRLEQCARYRQDADKKACALAYLLLERGLWEQYGIAPPISFVYNENGKPYLGEHPHIFFNISHCKSGVVCALSDIEVGIDIQDIRPFDLNIARRVCSEGELQRLDKSEDLARLFCEIWTEKESYAKARGISVASVLKCELPTERFGHWRYRGCCIAAYSEFCDYIIKRITQL